MNEYESHASNWFAIRDNRMDELERRIKKLEDKFDFPGIIVFEKDKENIAMHIRSIYDQLKKLEEYRIKQIEENRYVTATNWIVYNDK